jgi:hypothetical protein
MHDKLRNSLKPVSARPPLPQKEYQLVPHTYQEPLLGTEQSVEQHQELKLDFGQM